MENPIKMDDLGVPLFSETSMYVWGAPHGNCHGFCSWMSGVESSVIREAIRAVVGLVWIFVFFPHAIGFNIWMFPKIMGFPPQIIHFSRVFHDFHHPFWGIPIFFETPIYNGKLVVCGVCWFGILGIPENEMECYLGICLESQTTGPQTTVVEGSMYGIPWYTFVCLK